MRKRPLKADYLEKDFGTPNFSFQIEISTYFLKFLLQKIVFLRKNINIISKSNKSP